MFDAVDQVARRELFFKHGSSVAFGVADVVESLFVSEFD